MSTSPRKPPASEALVAGAVVVLLIAVVAVVFLSGAGSVLYPPPPATEQAREISGLYDIVFAIAVAIFIAVEGLIVWSVIRYRRKPTDTELPPQTHGNNFVEVLWTLIPTIIVLYLFVVSWQTLNNVEAVSDSPDVRVHAVAMQFQWQFEYLDANGTVLATQTIPTADGGGGMAVPVGRTVYVTLDAPDVIHAWYVPRFLFKRDVIPGQTNHFEFTLDPEEAGQTFRGQCAELCGIGHRAMLFDVIAMNSADFDSWLSALVEKSNATPPPAPSGAPVLDLVAKDIAFDKKTLEVPADAPFAIHLKNDDPAGVPHNIEIRDAGGQVLQDQPTIDGGEEITYSFDALPPGTYTFICKIHPIPGMTGTLTAN